MCKIECFVNLKICAHKLLSRLCRRWLNIMPPLSSKQTITIIGFPLQVAPPYSFSRVSLPGLESIIAGYLLYNTDSYFTNNSGLTSLWAHRTSLSTRMITLYSSITNQILLFAFVPHAFICSPKVDQYHGQYLPPLYRRIDAVATNTGQLRHEVK